MPTPLRVGEWAQNAVYLVSACRVHVGGLVVAARVDQQIVVTYGRHIAPLAIGRIPCDVDAARLRVACIANSNSRTTCYRDEIRRRAVEYRVCQYNVGCVGERDEVIGTHGRGPGNAVNRQTAIACYENTPICSPCSYATNIGNLCVLLSTGPHQIHEVVNQVIGKNTVDVNVSTETCSVRVVDNVIPRPDAEPIFKPSVTGLAVSGGVGQDNRFRDAFREIVYNDML